jgi:hypothetical protein
VKKILVLHLVLCSDKGDIGKALGELWKQVTPDQRQRCENLASLDKERYRREMEEFKRTGVVPGKASTSGASTPMAVSEPKVKKEGFKSEEFVDEDDDF